ncbi:peptidoglycan DD-metalloendopeptidase family protein [Terracoccus sp. 273MFTsu3.1]|uniref:peptidoglycan DD-metalloendopeptidase family protein n=1 Tax=Terracoccus sp. 273MFTsu3.1 TaxID=1172188 RepID=UPI0003A35762|nr:peptidoglycan DD-metalloendopeptidase family protein [Terracoccus sp. 273MFTsu3.1]
MSDIEGLIRRPTEPSPSSITPLLGTNRLQSAVDHMSKSVDKVSGWLDKASDRLAKMSAPTAGMGSGTTLNGGKQNGGGSSIGGVRMLGAGASNGAASGTPHSFLGMPYQQNIPTMTQQYGAPTQTGGKSNGGAVNWPRYGAALGGAWGAATVQAGLDRTQSFVASNTSAQLMTRSVIGGDWQRLRTGVVHDNWTATSDQDAFAGVANLRASGFTYGSRQWNSQMSQAKNYSMMDPTVSGADAGARIAAPQQIATTNYLLGRGINTRGKTGMAVADQMVDKFIKSNKSWSQKDYDSLWGAQGGARLATNQIAKVDPNAAALFQDRLQGTMQAQMHGMTKEAYRSAIDSGNWDALKQYGFSETDLNKTKEKAARQRNIDDNMAGGFSTGLNNAVDAIGAFQEALEKVTDGPLGAMAGYGHGWAGSSGLLGSATHIGGSMAGGYFGGKMASSLAKNGVKGTAINAASSGAGAVAKGASGVASVAGKAGKFMKGVPLLGLGIDAATTAFQGDERDRRKQNAMSHGWGDGMATYMSWRDTFASNLTFGLYGGAPDTQDPSSGGSAGERYGMFGTGGEKGGQAVKPVGNAPITAPFGRYKKSGKAHYGIDFGVPSGTPVRANRSGKVVVAGWSNTGFGNHVRIDIGDGTIEIYGHLSQLNVRVGQTIKAGDVIGKSGSSGNSTGPHLHFEVRKGGGGTGNAVDPSSYLKGADNPAPVSADAGSGSSVGSAGKGADGLGSARSMTASPWGVGEGQIVSGALGSLVGSMRSGSSGEGDSGAADAPSSPATAASGQFRDVLARAGFKGTSLGMAYAIMMAESGGNAHAHNTNKATGDNSYGLFQINMLGGMGPERRSKFHLANNDALFDPLTNAKVAYDMSKGGSDWHDWSTYKRGDYKKYLGGQQKSYDVGSTNIDVDQVARVHKGEMILDPVTADEMRKALSSNRPTDLFGSKGGKGGGIRIDNLTIQTAHQFTDSAATDLAKQFLSIVNNHDEVSTIMGGN